jgi:hypothetical protein
MNYLMIKQHKQFNLKPILDPSQEEYGPTGATPQITREGELRVAQRLANRFILQGLEYDSVVGLQTKYMIRGVDSTTYATETVFDSSKSAFKKIRTVSANANFNMTNGGRAGQELYMQIDNDTTANRTITFGGKFKVSGTLTGSTNATAMLQFISNGTNFMEVSRVTGINQ